VFGPPSLFSFFLAFLVIFFGRRDGTKKKSLSKKK
jgi:hypothetical protein